MGPLLDRFLFTGDISPYWGPFFFLLAAGAFAAIALLLGKAVRPRLSTEVKRQAYECGIDPIGDARERIPIRYYTVAMLFLLFDAEAIFLWPWAVAYNKEGVFFVVEALIFIVVVGFGYVYAWSKGAFEWRKI